MSRQHVADAGDAAVSAADHRESLERKGWPGAIPQQVFQALKIGRHIAVDECDPDTGVDGKPAVLPGEHVGCGTGHANHIVSKELFQDADIHAEFVVDPAAHGNSGLYLHGHYEMQIYDSFGVEPPTEQDEGALYRFGPPLVNAARRPGEWQVYDIRFIAPRRDASGRITKAGSVTAWLNGKLVQDGLTFTEPRSPYVPYRHGFTDYLRGVEKQLRATGRGPLFLQDHGSPTRYRNVWVRPL
jgi:hypothetical protein